MCCGSKDDYYTATPYRPANEKPHPSVSRGRYPPPPPRDPRLEEIEKRQRQAQATAAAQRYGWPTSRTDPRGYDDLQIPGNRDSLIEPGLASGLSTMPGSDFRAVYDPQRSPQRRRNHPPNRPRPTQSPHYYGQGFVDQQPGKMPPMRAPPIRTQPRQHAKVQYPVAYQHPSMPVQPVYAPQIRMQHNQYVRPEHQRPAVARDVVVQRQYRPPREPETARFSYVPQPRPVRKPSLDSNRISLCSDDSASIPRDLCVSPVND
ncbi:hypothetical protein F4803DRAFT_569306 [Xylaria telfairii]|nr:hypothetical protein F4803DRAFT_569306 [Xylaria telfairii]